MKVERKELLMSSFFLWLCLAFLALGGLGISYFVIWGRADEVNIRIIGNELLSSAEIREIIDFLLKKEKNTWTISSIEEALRLSLYIDSAIVRKIDYKTLLVRVLEKKTYFLRTEEPFVQQIASDKDLINEQIVQAHPSITRTTPIFTKLTQNIDPQVEEVLFRLFQETHTSHPFLWNRFSEISLDERNPGGILVSFYSSTSQLKIETNWPITKYTLERIWSVFYFIENVLEESSLDNYILVQLNEKNAVFRYL